MPRAVGPPDGRAGTAAPSSSRPRPITEPGVGEEHPLQRLGGHRDQPRGRARTAGAWVSPPNMHVRDSPATWSRAARRPAPVPGSRGSPTTTTTSRRRARGRSYDAAEPQARAGRAGDEPHRRWARSSTCTDARGARGRRRAVRRGRNAGVRRWRQHRSPRRGERMTGPALDGRRVDRDRTAAAAVAAAGARRRPARRGGDGVRPVDRRRVGLVGRDQLREAGARRARGSMKPLSRSMWRSASASWPSEVR